MIVPPVDDTAEKVDLAAKEERAWAWEGFWRTIKRAAGWGAIIAAVGVAVSTAVVGASWAAYQLWQDLQLAKQNDIDRRRLLAEFEERKARGEPVANVPELPPFARAGRRQLVVVPDTASGQPLEVREKVIIEKDGEPTELRSS